MVVLNCDSYISKVHFYAVNISKRKLNKAKDNVLKNNLIQFIVIAVPY